jgi:hypothetical protein
MGYHWVDGDNIGLDDLVSFFYSAHLALGVSGSCRDGDSARPRRRHPQPRSERRGFRTRREQPAAPSNPGRLLVPSMFGPGTASPAGTYALARRSRVRSPTAAHHDSDRPSPARITRRPHGRKRCGGRAACVRRRHAPSAFGLVNPKERWPSPGSPTASGRRVLTTRSGRPWPFLSATSTSRRAAGRSTTVRTAGVAEAKPDFSRSLFVVSSALTGTRPRGVPVRATTPGR